MTDQEPRDRDEAPPISFDANELVQQTLREAYLQNTEDLRDFAARVKHINEQKRAIRGYLSALRQLRAGLLAAARSAGLSRAPADGRAARELAGLFEKHAGRHEGGDVEFELGIPEELPPEEVRDFDALDAYIERWQGQLSNIGDDAQLANIDLQNALQKQQQALQMLSNVSKSVHDTAMAVVRNIRA